MIPEEKPPTDPAERRDKRAATVFVACSVATAAFTWSYARSGDPQSAGLMVFFFLMALLWLRP